MKTAANNVLYVFNFFYNKYWQDPVKLCLESVVLSMTCNFNHELFFSFYSL